MVLDVATLELILVLDVATLAPLDEHKYLLLTDNGVRRGHA